MGVVKAAGAVVVRATADGLRSEVLVVHRPRYDDWSLPKGKRDAQDADDQWTARREVFEETGYVVELGVELPNVSYTDRNGRPKLVRYWLASVVDGEFVPNDEVDVVDWLEQPQVNERLTYPRDRDVVASALEI
jgi:8-oxo-dGTP pyrophosphatase MutT (NUDIX family)